MDGPNTYHLSKDFSILLSKTANTILYGNVIDTNKGLINNIDPTKDPIQPISLQTYVDKLIHQQQKLIVAVQKTQHAYYQQHNHKQHQRKANRQYKASKPNQQRAKQLDEHVRNVNIDTAQYCPIRQQYPTLPFIQDITQQDHIIKSSALLLTPDKRPSSNWILDPSIPSNDLDHNTPGKWIRLSDPDAVPLYILQGVAKQLRQDQLTRHSIGDYVLRRHPPTKLGHGPSNKYGSFWRGPYLVIGTDDTLYTLQNLVTGALSEAHVQQLKPFYYDPKYVTPLNIAARDDNEFIVEKIIDHEVNEDGTMLWRVRWLGYNESDDTWETLSTLQDVEQFHIYCQTNSSLHKYLPSKIRRHLTKRK
jgi:hypothetical protein